MRITALAICLLAAADPMSLAHAQTGDRDFPVRPMRIIVGYGPGTAMDTISRLVGQHMSSTWGQQVIVENREGAGGTIGAGVAARAQPDGYTLHIVAPSFVVSPFLGQLPYEPVRDFKPVTLAAVVPLALVMNAQLPPQSLRELIAYAKSNPGKLQFASSGRGSTSSLTGQLFASMAGVDIADVPYKSTSQAFGDVISGRIALYFPSLAPAMPHIQAGRLRALGVSTAARVSAAPEIPPVAEVLPGFDVSLWYGFVVPAQTPAKVVELLNREIVRGIRLPEVKAKLTALGVEVHGSTSAEFLDLWKVEQKRWASLLKDVKVQ